NPLIAASRFLPSRRRVVVDASTRQLTSLNAGQLGRFGVRFLSLGRAIFGCCPLNLYPTHHVARQSIDAPENHLRRLSSVVRYGPNVARGSEKHVPEIEE